MKRFLTVVVAGFLLSCAPLKNSPFSEETESSVSNLNGQYLGSLKNSPLFYEPADEVTFGVFSDSHQNYAALEDWVKDANSMDFDFVVSLGDFTNQGLNFEYDAYLSLISPLRVPLVTVLGNHDSVGRGKLLYKRLFGPYNFHFDHKGYRFVIFNNNRLDFIDEKIEWDWLAQEVRSSPLPIVLLMHVDPDNDEYFTSQDKEIFWDIVRDSSVRLIMNGHKHVYHTEVKAGILRHQVERLERGRWSRITLKEDEVVVEQCLRKECKYETQKDYHSGSELME
ncbi:metallophosphoesterase family protein [Bdellovibrio sp. BCCA]|uniref:metallophosphoesterase family protein n=1 Tax=Bdellovibrio sp. BCCA TaxID=3136281 RepID=UPI0030F02BC3